MCCKSFWKKVIPFVLAFMLSFYVVSFAKEWSFANENKINVSRTTKSPQKTVYSIEKLESEAIVRGNKILFKSEVEKIVISKKEKVQIIRKTIAKYTDEARQNQIQGTVRSRAALSVDGEVRNIVPVANLPFGLTNEAVIAASQIKFKPALRNGKSISTTVVI